MNTIENARNLVRASFPRRHELEELDANNDAIMQGPLDAHDGVFVDNGALARGQRVRRRRKIKTTSFPKELMVMMGGLLMFAFYGIVRFFKTVRESPRHALPLIGWALAIWFGVGAIYFCIYAIVLVFKGLGERKEGEVSAYSVFNEDGRRLPGTFDAENFLGRA